MIHVRPYFILESSRGPVIPFPLHVLDICVMHKSSIWSLMGCNTSKTVGKFSIHQKHGGWSPGFWTLLKTIPRLWVL